MNTVVHRVFRSFSYLHATVVDFYSLKSMSHSSPLPAYLFQNLFTPDWDSF